LRVTRAVAALTVKCNSHAVAVANLDRPQAAIYGTANKHMYHAKVIITILPEGSYSNGGISKAIPECGTARKFAANSLDSGVVGRGGRVIFDSKMLLDP